MPINTVDLSMAVAKMAKMAEEAEKDSLNLQCDVNATRYGQSAYSMEEAAKATMVSANVVRSHANTSASTMFNKTEETLGSGMCGAVRTVEHKVTKEQFALKTLEKNANIATHHIAAEVKAFVHLNHKNICKGTDVFETDSAVEIVMEKLNGGNVFDLFSSMKQAKETTVKEVAKQMFEAVAYMHEQGYMHRDIKLQNVVFANDASKDLTCKLVDFGFVTKFKANGLHTTKCGTFDYMAPEVLKNAYDQRSDNWSLGVCLFMMLGGYAPFRSAKGDVNETISNIEAKNITWYGKRWNNVSDEGLDLVNRLLQEDPAVRITAQQALKHPFFA